MSAPLLELRQVFCVHRTAQGDAAALQGLDLDIGRGESLCILGPSGAGKTTLLRVIAGLQLPSAGSVTLVGRDMGRLGSRERAELRHRNLGFLNQSSRDALAPELTARQAVALPLALVGVGRKQRNARATRLLDSVGLGDRGGARPAELSGGERQRVALCVALSRNPSLLLADEPTGELDEGTSAAAYALIASRVRESGAAAIIASHDPLASRHAERTLVLRDGRIVEELGGRSAALVVGRGGWVRIPDRLRERANLGARVIPKPGEGGLTLVPAAAQTQKPESIGARPPSALDRLTPSAPSRVELVDLTRSYRQGATERMVIGGLTHTFAPARLTVIQGRSGSGKTTLLRLIAGLDHPDRGEIVIDGARLSGGGVEQRAELRRKRIGYLDQDPDPIGFLSARENVELALRVHGWDRREVAVRAATVLDLLGLPERIDQRAARLSAGEAQRLGLARALAVARGLLLVDEPTSRLDEANASMVAKLLAAAASLGNTVVCASHDPAVIAEAHTLLAMHARDEQPGRPLAFA